MCSVMGSLLHRTKIVHADIPPNPNSMMTKCAQRARKEREAKKAKAQDLIWDTQIAVQMKTSSCVYKEWSGMPHFRLDTVWEIKAVSQCSCRTSLQPLHRNRPGRWSEAANGERQNITWKCGSRRSRNNRSALFVLYPCNRGVDANRTLFQVAILWFLFFPLQCWPRLT